MKQVTLQRAQEISKHLAAVADTVAVSHLNLKQAEKDWEEKRGMALKMRRRRFASGKWEIAVSDTERNNYDAKKLEEFFAKKGIDPAQFKTMTSGQRVLVKPLP